MEVKDFIVFNAPDLGEEEMSAVMDVIRSGWIGTGKVSRQFEEEFADFMGGGYAVSVGSCTIGLQIALKSIGIREDNEVIVPAMTFAATLNAVLASGAWPVLVDVDMQGFINVNKANEAIIPVTKAIIPVHYSGQVGNLKGFDKRVKIVEDCAHAFGSVLPRLGEIQVFSFYANKTITSGEGGMVLTKDKKVAEEVRVLSAQGLSLGAWQRYGKGPVRQYSVEKVGVKGNMPDVLAAIGLAQLRRWPGLKQKRKEVWKVYEKSFGKKPAGHSTNFYPIFVKNRDEFRAKLHKKGIGTGVHYKPLHLEPAYKFLGYKKGDFPNAETFGEQEMSLPVSAKMTKEDAERVVHAFCDIMMEGKD